MPPTGTGGTSGAASNGGTLGSGAGTGGSVTAGSAGASPTGGTAGTSAGGSAGTGYVGPWPPSETYSNPVLWEDLADVDVIRVDDTFYYTASNMHYSPGAPILRSFDLVNWEYAGHAVPALDFSSKYDLEDGQAYIKGTWASALNYRESNQTFYFVACIEFGKTYVYTASSVDGEWTKHPAINNCYYDAGLLIDDDDTMYVAYGNTQISVARLSADGLSEVEHKQVFTTPASIGTLEGARFYKVNGKYYIFVTRPANGQYILKSDDPFGPYEAHELLLNLPGPIQGGGVPHQGGLVQLQNGDWYYLGFIDAYPGGRVPALAPITWNEEGWPVLELVDGKWGAEYPYPDVPKPPRNIAPRTGIDRFEAEKLGHEWEWNHNPDNSKWSLGAGGLKLETATVTTDLYRARNTLTRRILGPTSTATVELDVSAMKDGDRTGLALLRQSSAWIGVKKTGTTTTISMTNGLTMDGSWNTTSTGTEAASAPLTGDKVWLRVAADVRPGANSKGKFSYSTDGVAFTPLGPDFTMNNQWQFFMGYRYAIFNHATSSAGGAVTVRAFEVATP
jgi:beta-xylosidase